jgi:hypothetical protein
MGGRRAALDPGRVSFAPAALPLIQREPELGGDWVRFVQTAGGPIGLPAPRRVRGKPYFRFAPGVSWTTLQLVIYADGLARGSLVGASRFPRHWIYDHAGQLIEKSATIDFEAWYRESAGENTPWGGEDTHAFVSSVETELERSLAASVMQGGGELLRCRLDPSEILVEQGAAGEDLFVLLDGLLDVEIDGKIVAQVGPGAMVGELAAFEGGVRTATLRAATRCRLVRLSPAQISRYERSELALSRHPSPL